MRRRRRFEYNRNSGSCKYNSYTFSDSRREKRKIPLKEKRIFNYTINFKQIPYCKDNRYLLCILVQVCLTNKRL